MKFVLLIKGNIYLVFNSRNLKASLLGIEAMREMQT